MDMAGARALLRQVADLNRVMNGGQSQLNPDARAVKAATELYVKIKSWPESIRQLIDSLDAKVSGGLSHRDGRRLAVHPSPGVTTPAPAPCPAG
jgi:hypothetical protein